MKNKQNSASTRLFYTISIWGFFFLLFTYFRWDVNAVLISLFEARSKVGADFNTDSAVTNYLLISNGRLLTIMMIVSAGVCSGLVNWGLALNSKLKMLEGELSEIKQKLDV